MVSVKIIRTTEYDDRSLERSHSSSMSLFLDRIGKTLNEVNITTTYTKKDLMNGCQYYVMETVIIYEVDPAKKKLKRGLIIE